MNINRIKKSLESCSKSGVNYCDDCPYHNAGRLICLKNKMLEDALNLINEQENQIASLQREVEKKNER